MKFPLRRYGNAGQSMLSSDFTRRLYHEGDIIRSSPVLIPNWPVIRMLAGLACFSWSVTLWAILRDVHPLDGVSFAIGGIWACFSLCFHQVGRLKHPLRIIGLEDR